MKCEVCLQKSEEFLFMVDDPEGKNTPQKFEYTFVICEDCVEDVLGVEMIDYYATN